MSIIVFPKKRVQPSGTEEAVCTIVDQEILDQLAGDAVAAAAANDQSFRLDFSFKKIGILVDMDEKEATIVMYSKHIFQIMATSVRPITQVKNFTTIEQLKSAQAPFDALYEAVFVDTTNPARIVLNIAKTKDCHGGSIALNVTNIALTSDANEKVTKIALKVVPIGGTVLFSQIIGEENLNRTTVLSNALVSFEDVLAVTNGDQAFNPSLPITSVNKPNQLMAIQYSVIYDSSSTRFVAPCGPNLLNNQSINNGKISIPLVPTCNVTLPSSATNVRKGISLIVANYTPFIPFNWQPIFSNNTTPTIALITSDVSTELSIGSSNDTNYVATDNFVALHIDVDKITNGKLTIKTADVILDVQLS